MFITFLGSGFYMTPHYQKHHGGAISKELKIGPQPFCSYNIVFDFIGTHHFSVLQ